MLCLNCKSETKNPKFCSRSCSATYNNIRYPKRFLENSCKICSKKITSARSYCDACWQDNSAKSKYKISSWLSKDWRGGTDSGLSQIVRKYLLEKSNYSCSKCGFNINHPDDGRTILEINHIDGDGLNHSPENLEVVCPNCHALTSNYRARNMGNGRPVYYLRKSIT